ncbi:MAG: exo-alpha-sialidase [Candidatus Anammoximicrobium sp.]|nr:exo-alpha-sialidase [Candidatus Anammoximicrobium sp.]
MVTRRRFLQQAAGAAAGASWFTGRSLPGGQRSAPKIAPDVIVYDGVYPGWPWIAAHPDGTLYCVFREGTEHGYSAVGRALLTRSSDRGRSWSAAAVIVDQPQVDDRNVALTVLANGDLLVAYNTYDAARQSQAMTVRSADGGRSWSKPQPLDHTNTRTKSAAVTLSNGHLLLPYYIAPGSGALAALSADSGATWSTVRIPDTEGFVGDEWDVLEVEPGRLVGIFRNSHPKTDGTFWKSESRDGGRTWSAPRPTNVRSQRHPSPAQITRQNGAVTLIYADRRMVSVSAVTTSDPDFLRWDLDRRLFCFLYQADERPIRDGSYPVSAPVDARTRLIVDYEIRPKSRRIAGYFVTFPDDWGRPA